MQDQSRIGEVNPDCVVPDDGDLESRRYPIGRLRKGPQPTPEKHERWIDLIETLPGGCVRWSRISPTRLDTPYRPGGWTIRQVVHHLADSHMNGCIRTKSALTEDLPTIKSFDEEAWAKLPDARAATGTRAASRWPTSCHGRGR